MSLREQAVRGVQWTSLASVVVVVCSLAQTAVLSRLLERRDFGLTAMVWAVLGFAQAFADLGTGNAIIQKQDATPRQLASVFWLNIAVGAALALATSALAWPIAWSYREPELAPLVPWAGVTFLFVSFGQSFQMISQRMLRFSVLAAADSLAALLALITATVSAWHGAGPYSLLAAGIVSSLTRSTVFAAGTWRYWRPEWYFSLSDVRDFLRFGAFQMAERCANYFWNNIDYFFIGRYLGADSLGVYRLAYETVTRPLGTVNPVLNTVAFPLFAKRQHDSEALRRGFCEMIHLLGFLVFPLMAGLAAVAPLAVEVVFGPKWAPAAPLIQIMVLFGALRSLNNPAGALLLAKGLVEKSFVLNLILAVVYGVAFRWAVTLGVAAVCWTAVAILAAYMMLSWRTLYGNTIGLTPGEYIQAVIRPVAISLIMALCVLVAQSLLERLGVPPLLRLGSLIAIGAAIYLAVAVLLDHEYTKRLAGMLRFRRAAAPTDAL